MQGWFAGFRRDDRVVSSPRTLFILCTHLEMLSVSFSFAQQYGQPQAQQPIYGDYDNQVRACAPKKADADEMACMLAHVLYRDRGSSASVQSRCEASESGLTLPIPSLVIAQLHVRLFSFGCAHALFMSRLRARYQYLFSLVLMDRHLMRGDMAIMRGSTVTSTFKAPKCNASARSSGPGRGTRRRNHSNAGVYHVKISITSMHMQAHGGTAGVSSAHDERMEEGEVMCHKCQHRCVLIGLLAPLAPSCVNLLLMARDYMLLRFG